MAKNVKMKALTSEIRKRILANEGCSLSEWARRRGFSEAYTRNCIRRYIKRPCTPRCLTAFLIITELKETTGIDLMQKDFMRDLQEAV